MNRSVYLRKKLFHLTLLNYCKSDDGMIVLGDMLVYLVPIPIFNIYLCLACKYIALTLILFFSAYYIFL